MLSTYLNFSKWTATSGSGMFPKVLKLISFYLIFLCDPNSSVMGTECMKRKYFEITFSYFGGLHINRTLKCDMYFQWTVQDFCCEDFQRNFFCCYSETYKLVLAVSFICLILFIGTFTIFFCWVYNLPHHLLYILTCGRFHLSSWLLRNKNGPYVDPSFYSGEPFWARGAEMQPYPLRPMPPKIFYPAPPPKLKYRWDMSNCDIPLFIIASRQFTRNPYSARPQDRNNHYNSSGIAQLSVSTGCDSRRNSLFSNYNGSNGGGGTVATSASGDGASNQAARRDSNSAPNGILRRGSSALLHQRDGTPRGYGRNKVPPFKVNLDEGEAAAELIHALKVLEEGTESAQAEDELNKKGQNNSLKGATSMEPPPRKIREEEETYDLSLVRPNTTGGSGSLDQYGNYVSLPPKPNISMLNQQLTNLRLPVYNMPGVHSGIVTTVQNYHVVSSNLGNPMETILEDDSLEDDYYDRCSYEQTTKPDTPAPVTSENKGNKNKQGLKRRAASIAAGEIGRVSSRVSSAMDHVVLPTPTTRAVVPFTPTLPGSLSDNDCAQHREDVHKRRNSVV